MEGEEFLDGSFGGDWILGEVIGRFAIVRGSPSIAGRADSFAVGVT